LQDPRAHGGAGFACDGRSAQRGALEVGHGKREMAVGAPSVYNDDP